MRSLLVRRRTLGAAMSLHLPGLAMIGIGTDEHPPALVVGDDLIEVGIVCSAQCAGRVEAIAGERMILEIERHHRRMGRYSIDTLLAPGAEQLQRRTIIHLRIVEF